MTAEAVNAASMALKKEMKMLLHGSEPQTTLSLDDINLGDPDFWLRDDFYGALAMLRKERPISWHEHPEAGKGFWALLDHEDIAEVDKDWEAFSSKYGVRVYHDAGTKVRPGTGALIELDPPEHTVNRKRVSKAFTPRQVGSLEGSVREHARRLVSELSEGQEIDFVDDLAALLPFEIICDLVGVDPADRPHLLKLSTIGRSEQELEYAGKPEIPQQAVNELHEYGVNLAAKRLLDPKEDLISELAQVQVDGKPIAEGRVGRIFWSDDLCRQWHGAFSACARDAGVHAVPGPAPPVHQRSCGAREDDGRRGHSLGNSAQASGPHSDPRHRVQRRPHEERSEDRHVVYRGEP
ncbi:hypothetical protein LP414_10425 [Polaromonas sp. P1(28)-13]|nr:hypothetical protein LP414_10425 [Polaromonas sp. P1(28)-13]